jgi:hypothetical protein
MLESMKEETEKEKESGPKEPVENPQEISHDHIRQARGESLKEFVNDLEDNLKASGYKEIMKI